MVAAVGRATIRPATVAGNPAAGKAAGGNLPERNPAQGPDQATPGRRLRRQTASAPPVAPRETSRVHRTPTDRGGVARVSHLGARVPAGFGAKQPRAVGRAAWDSQSTGTRDRTGVARVSHLGARVPAGFGAKQPRAVGRAAWDSESTGTRDRGGVARVSHLGARVPAGFGAKQPRAVGRAAWDSQSTGTRDRGGVARVSHLGARVPAGFGAKQPRAVGRAAWDSESTGTRDRGVSPGSVISVPASPLASPPNGLGPSVVSRGIASPPAPEAATGVDRVSHLGARVPAGFAAERPRAVGLASPPAPETAEVSPGSVISVPASPPASAPTASGRRSRRVG